MTSKAALCKALLRGEVVNIKNGFTNFGITNIPREIGRSIEREFGVVVSRVRMEGTSRYGQPVTWTNYRLNKIEANLEGINKMLLYVQEQEGFPKTEKQAKEQKQLQEGYPIVKPKKYIEQSLFDSK